MKFKKLKTANRSEILASRNNALMIVIAFVCALAAWFLVTMKFYASQEKILTDVPLITDTSSDSQFEIMSVEKDGARISTVNVTLDCSRYHLKRITNGTVVAYVDIDDITAAGKYKLPVQIKNTIGAEISNIQVVPSFVTVEIDTIDTKTVTLQADTSNLKIADDKIFSEVRCDPQVIEIKGPSQKLKNISSAYAVSDYDKTIDSSRHINSSRYILFDEEGNEITNHSKLVFLQNTTDISLTVKTQKTVPIVASFQTNDPNFDKSSIDYSFTPNTITLAAESADSISDPFEIKVAVSDIDDVDFEADYPINNAKLDSDNVENISMLESVHFTLNGSSLASKEITLSNSNMHPMQIPDDDYDYNIVTESLKVTLIGPKDLLNDITASDINANVYLSNAESEPIVFPRDVEITFKSKAHNKVWAVTDQKANIRKTPKSEASAKSHNN